MKKRIILVLIIAILLSGCNKKEIEIEKSSIIKENLYSFNRKHPINGDFDGYFQYRDENNQKNPLLVHLTFNYYDQNKEYDKISELIYNLKFSLIGIDGELETIESFNDKDAFSNSYYINNVSNQLVEPIENEAAIAFLKNNFGEKIIINNINDEYIEYEVKEQLDHMQFLIRFTKDQRNDQIVIELEN